MHGISDTLTSLLVIRHIGIYHNCQKNITQNTLLFVTLTYSTKQANKKKNIYKCIIVRSQNFPKNKMITCALDTF